MRTEEQECLVWRFNRKLGVVAWLLFAISLFMPVYSMPWTTCYGWEVYKDVGMAIGDLSSYARQLVQNPRIYFSKLDFMEKALSSFYFALILADVLMIFSPLLLLKFLSSRSQIFHYASLAAFLFFIVGCLFPLCLFITIDFKLSYFRLGYGIWISSFGLLALSIHEKKFPTNN